LVLHSAWFIRRLKSAKIIPFTAGCDWFRAKLPV